MKKSVGKEALKDISIYLGKIPITYNDKGEPEVWDVGISVLLTKETTRMNRELGLSKINKQNNHKNFGQKRHKTWQF